MEIDDKAEQALRYSAKAVLRKRARALRSTIPAEALAERSRRIEAALAGLPEVLAAGAVALFWPIDGKSEVDLRTFDSALRSRGVRVAYPSIDPDTRVMTFRFVADPLTMAERGLGFLEPAASDEECALLDVIVVPALQLDPSGYRIGYGAGFYDRALPRFAPPARKVGVGYDFQLIPEVPVTEGDVAVDAIVTDARVLEIVPSACGSQQA